MHNQAHVTPFATTLGTLLRVREDWRFALVTLEATELPIRGRNARAYTKVLPCGTEVSYRLSIRASEDIVVGLFVFD
jgi:hypothetical protein